MMMDIPCKIGDMVWGLRRQGRGGFAAKQGEVFSMYFVDPEMTLAISVKGVGTGVWGEKVFATQEEAERAVLAKNAEGSCIC